MKKGLLENILNKNQLTITELDNQGDNITVQYEVWKDFYFFNYNKKNKNVTFQKENSDKCNSELLDYLLWKVELYFEEQAI